MHKRPGADFHRRSKSAIRGNDARVSLAALAVADPMLATTPGAAVVAVAAGPSGRGWSGATFPGRCARPGDVQRFAGAVVKATRDEAHQRRAWIREIEAACSTRVDITEREAGDLKPILLKPILPEVTKAVRERVAGAPNYASASVHRTQPLTQQRSAPCRATAWAFPRVTTRSLTCAFALGIRSASVYFPPAAGSVRDGEDADRRARCGAQHDDGRQPHKPPGEAQQGVSRSVSMTPGQLVHEPLHRVRGARRPPVHDLDQLVVRHGLQFGILHAPILSLARAT
jgi:hypothetical protein